MSEPFAQDSTLDYHDDTDQTDYHPISGAAVAALCLGVASAAALAGPVLWLLPLAGILASLWALWRIERVSPRPVGRIAALIGLALSVIFGVAAPARTLLRDWYLDRQASSQSWQWIELLQQGDGYAAHQYFRPSNMRMMPGADLKRVYEKDPNAKQAYETFVSKRPVRLLLEHGHKATVEYDHSAGRSSEPGRDLIGQVYKVTPPAEAKTEPGYAVLFWDRRVDPKGDATWVLRETRDEDSHAGHDHTHAELPD